MGDGHALVRGQAGRPPNRLIHETSSYPLQHAPVTRRLVSRGEEPKEKGQRIFLSIWICRLLQVPLPRWGSEWIGGILFLGLRGWTQLHPKLISCLASRALESLVPADDRFLGKALFFVNEIVFVRRHVPESLFLSAGPADRNFLYFGRPSQSEVGTGVTGRED